MSRGVAITRGGAPDAELAGASLVEVEERMGESTTYRLHYPVDIRESELPFLADDRLDAGSKLAVLAFAGSETHCLVKGPVNGQRIVLTDGGEGSLLEVRGTDSATDMAREVRAEVWDNVTDSDAVTRILAGYGYIPDVERTTAGHFESKHSLVQRSSDLDFVRRLACRNGRLFWIRSNALGIETAHWKRPPFGGRPAAALAINTGPGDKPSSIRRLEIEWDTERPIQVEAHQLDLNTLGTFDAGVDGTPLELLGRRGLDEIVGGPRSTHLVAPADDAGNLRARGEATVIEAGAFVRATCQTSLAALKTVVRAHTVVEVEGAGGRHSGRYFVAAVRHVIDTKAHRMELELIRNAWN